MKIVSCALKKSQLTTITKVPCSGPSTHFIRDYFLTEEAVKKNEGSPHLFYCDRHAKMVARMNPEMLGGPKIERIPERKRKRGG